jgi:hypothetical protein
MNARTLLMLVPFALLTACDRAASPTGGRWWVDANGNGIQDQGDAFLLCPLLGPGREEP